MNRKSNDQSLKEVLQLLITDNNLKPKYYLNRVRHIWAEQMGQTISSYTKSISFQNTTLFITIESAPLRQELNFGKDKIKKILNDELGEAFITEVVIK